MRLDPTAIPAISREAIAVLTREGDIEVEPTRVADAEMDLAAIMREHLTGEERVNQATREALERRGYWRTCAGSSSATRASHRSSGRCPSSCS